MRITSITGTQKTTTGDYEHLVLVISATVDEEENAAEAATDLTDFLDWFARKPIRDGQAHKYRLALADENTTPEKRAAAERWLARYDARKAKVEAM